MQSVLNVTGPVYLLIATGFLLVRFGVLAAADMRILGRFVIQVCIPALLLRTLANLPIHEVLRWNYLLAYSCGSLLSLATVFLFCRYALGRSVSLSAIQGLGASSSNSVFVGFPIIQQLIGPSAGLALALVQLVENLLIVPLSLILADAQSGRSLVHTLKGTVRALLRNPMIDAILIGLAISTVGLPMPVMLDKSIGLVGSAAAPTALLVIGGSLVGLQVAGLRRELAMMSLAKLGLHPLAVLACLTLVSLTLEPVDPPFYAAAILFASMPMLSIYPILAQRHGHEKFSAAILLVVTILSFFTVSALISIMPPQWLSAPPAPRAGEALPAHGRVAARAT